MLLPERRARDCPGRCAMFPLLERERLLAQVDEWAGEGLRLLGLAFRRDGILEDYSGYTWLGLLGMEDPVRRAYSTPSRWRSMPGSRSR